MGGVVEFKCKIKWYEKKNKNKNKIHNNKH